jgi:glycosyltransferase involved in cell wall biosynthesis
VSARRVVFVAHNFPRHDGDAAGGFLLDLAHALTQAGITVHVVAPHAPGLPARHRVGGIDVLRVRYAADARETLAYTGTMAEQVTGSPAAAWAMVGMLRALGRATRALVREVGADIVHAHWWFPSALAVGGTARAAGVPLVVTSHGSDVRLARGGIARRLARHALRDAAAVTTVSRWLGDALQPLAPVPVSIAPMPADTTLFHEDSTVRRDPRRILFVGRLNAQKAPMLLVEALAALPRDTTLELVGEGTLREALVARAASLGVAERVTFAGTVPRADLPARMRTAAVVAVPSRDEGFGLVAAEALLCGTPVVASDQGGLRDIVRDGQTGVAVHAAEPAAWASALRGILDDPARASALADHGRRAMLALVAPEAVAARHVAIYADAITRHRARG